MMHDRDAPGPHTTRSTFVPGQQVWVQYEGERWPAIILPSTRYNIDGIRHQFPGCDTCVEFYDEERSFGMCRASDLEPLPHPSRVDRRPLSREVRDAVRRAHEDKIRQKEERRAAEAVASGGRAPAAAASSSRNPAPPSQQHQQRASGYVPVRVPTSAMAAARDAAAAAAPLPPQPAAGAVGGPTYTTEELTQISRYLSEIDDQTAQVALEMLRADGLDTSRLSFTSRSSLGGGSSGAVPGAADRRRERSPEQDDDAMGTGFAPPPPRPANMPVPAHAARAAAAAAPDAVGGPQPHHQRQQQQHPSPTQRRSHSGLGDAAAAAPIAAAAPVRNSSGKQHHGKATAGAATAADAFSAALRELRRDEAWEPELATELLEAAALASVGPPHHLPSVVGAVRVPGACRRVRFDVPPAPAAIHDRSAARLVAVPASDSGDMPHPWMEKVPLDDAGRLALMRIGVGPYQRVGGPVHVLQAPANWSIPVARAAAWNCARTSVALDLTAAAADLCGVTADAGGTLELFVAFDSGGDLLRARRHPNADGGGSDDDDEDDDDAIALWEGNIVLLWVEERPHSFWHDVLRNRPVAGRQTDAEAAAGTHEGTLTTGGGPRSPATALDDEDDDDVAVQQHESRTTVALRCPVSFMPMTLPVRSTACGHPQCADAAAVVQMGVSSHFWRCPICLAAAPWAEWGVDAQLVAAMKRASPGTTQLVAIGPNAKGEYSYETLTEGRRR